jgi:Xaa-Pro aminopeptidase
MVNTLIKQKINQTYEILNEKNIDLWMIFVRESSNIKDPTLDMVVGSNCTWESAFLFHKDGSSTAIVGSLEENNFSSLGIFNSVVPYLKSVTTPLREYFTTKNPKKIAINYSRNSNLADGLTHGMYLNLLNHLDKLPYSSRFISSEDIISALKGRKSAGEVEIIKDAIAETEKIFENVSGFIKPGVSEIEIADYIKAIVKSKGWGLAWEADHCPAVFTGPDTAGAHASPTDRKVERGHLVNIDFGIRYNGYCSDIQRTWYVLKEGESEAPAEVIKGFKIIRDAILMVKEALVPGVIGCEMDDIARNYITGNGYEEYPHGLGHQVGRLVHDGGAGLFPRWERYGNLPYQSIEENQIFTIEPRLPVKGYGVSTLEEMVIVTKEGARFLTNPQNELWLIK